MGKDNGSNLEDWALFEEDDQLAAIAEERVELLKEIGRKERTIAKLKRGEQVLVDAVHSALDELPPLKIPPRPKKSRGKRETVAVAMLSDTQLGKTTETYDTTVCRERCLAFARKVVEMADIRRAGGETINICKLLLGGDMVEGETIFPGQAHEIEQSVFDQAIRTGPSIFVEVILILMEGFNKVEVHTVPGNHGRPGRKGGEHSTRTNWDNVCYEATKLILVGNDQMPRKEMQGRLEFNVSETWYTVIRLWSWGILMLHGDQISGGFAGHPWYGASRRAQGWADAIREPWDILVYGHFHTPAMATVNHRLWIANGSTESDNEFARSQMAAAGDPAQWLFFFNEEKGLISQHLVYLHDRVPQSKRHH